MTQSENLPPMKNLRYPVFGIDFPEEFRKEFYAGCEQIFDEAYLTNHTFVRKFEESFRSFTNAKFCTMTSSGTTALETALRAVDVSGKDVLLSTNTFIATAVAILNAGGKPVPIDIEEPYWSISTKKLQQNLNSNTGAVVVVHTGGIVPPNMFEILDLCRSLDVPLIEDAAHAHGSYLQEKHAGTIGDIGCFSFYLTKTITSGEGGALITNNEKLQEAFISIRQFGKKKNDSTLHERDGSNFKVTEFQGLLGHLDLKRAPDRIRLRQKNADIYQQRLKNSDFFPLIPPSNGTCGHYKQVITSKHKRKFVEKHLEKVGVPLTGGVYYTPIHQQPVFQSQFDQDDFPVSNYFSQFHFCPPCIPELQPQEIHEICDYILSFEGN